MAERVMTPEEAARAIILKDGDRRLKQRCQPWVFGVTHPEDPYELAELLNRTMRKAGGVGLAAPQLGIMRRVFCIALGASAGLVCFNPAISERLGGPVKPSEGCLSYPGVFINVWRSEGVKARFQTVNGTLIERELWGREAHAYQHELDHLDGRTLPDFVPAHVWERERLPWPQRAP